jgi:hypothetical protein
MVGSIIRIGSSSTKPTGLAGTNPFIEERSILSVSGATELELDANAANTQSLVAYRITDPIDIHESMFDAFIACCRKQLANRRNLENQGVIYAQYVDALHAAKCAQLPTMDRAIMGQRPVPFLRFVDRCTMGDDVE